MKKLHVFQATGAIFLALGAFMITEGWRLGLKGMYGPGPGFFPFVVGTGLASASLAWLVQTTFRTSQAELPNPELPTGGAVRIALILAALVIFALLLIPLGFNLTMLALLLFLLIGFSREYLVLKLVIAVLASFGTHYVFEQLLRVPLPYAGLPALRELGL